MEEVKGISKYQTNIIKDSAILVNDTATKIEMGITLTSEGILTEEQGEQFVERQKNEMRRTLKRMLQMIESD